MKCWNHENRDAVGTCKKCGKYYCKDCFGGINVQKCAACWDEEREAKQKREAQERKDEKGCYYTIAGIIAVFILGTLIVALLSYFFPRSEF